MSSFYFSEKRRVCYRRLDFLGFPGYRIGDDGSVWTKWLNISKGYRHGFIAMIQGPWRRFKLQSNKDGYQSVLLRCATNKKRLCRVHRLVLLAFYGPQPAGHQSRHFPERNPSNNRLENLSWATPKVNNSDKRIHGTLRNQYKPQYGENNGNTSLTNDQVRKIKALHANKTMRNVEIMRLFKISQTIFYSMISGKTWRSVT